MQGRQVLVAENVTVINGVQAFTAETPPGAWTALSRWHPDYVQAFEDYS